MKDLQHVLKEQNFVPMSFSQCFFLHYYVVISCPYGCCLPGSEVTVSGADEMVLLSHKGTIPWCSCSARITIPCFPLRHSSAEITVLLRLLQAPKVIYEGHNVSIISVNKNF